MAFQENLLGSEAGYNVSRQKVQDTRKETMTAEQMRSLFEGWQTRRDARVAVVSRYRLAR